ncbi:hypothetical protein [Zavarzinia sp. CC-PAN008]|uniref:hypothetical protein n=1 Tax=Zavarzinia sp. CC-PAN008 TaxID=3243332 RepID=UPI003F7443C7
MIPGGRDDHSLLWLALGTAALILAAGTVAAPAAMWLALVLLVRYVRSQPALQGLAVGAGAVAAAMLVVVRALSDAPPSLYAALVVGGLVTYFLPLALDRLLQPRLARLGLLGTLALPCLVVLTQYLYRQTQLPGSEIGIALSQTGNSAVLQIASWGGEWAIAFMLAWFASLVAHGWGHMAAGQRTRGQAALGVAALVTGLAMLGGWFRTEVYDTAVETVRVAMIMPGVDGNGGMRLLDAAHLVREESGQPPLDVAGLRPPLAMMPLRDALVERTAREAAAGASIIFWPGLPELLGRDDEVALVDSLREIALERGVAIALALDAPDPGAERAPNRNRFLMIDPQGTLAWEYLDGESFRTGQWRLRKALDVVPQIDTGFGRLGGIVAYDATYPSVLAAAGRAGVQLALDPALDIADLEPVDSSLATLAAVEYGMTIARVSSTGHGMMVDRYGRRQDVTHLARAYDPVMVAQMPARAQPTLYAAWPMAVPAGSAAVLALLLAAVLPWPRLAVGRPARAPQPVRQGLLLGARVLLLPVRLPFMLVSGLAARLKALRERWQARRAARRGAPVSPDTGQQAVAMTANHAVPPDTLPADDVLPVAVALPAAPPVGRFAAWRKARAERKSARTALRAQARTDKAAARAAAKAAAAARRTPPVLAVPQPAPVPVEPAVAPEDTAPEAVEVAAAPPPPIAPETEPGPASKPAAEPVVALPVEPPFPPDLTLKAARDASLAGMRASLTDLRQVTRRLSGDEERAAAADSALDPVPPQVPSPPPAPPPPAPPPAAPSPAAPFPAVASQPVPPAPVEPEPPPFASPGRAPDNEDTLVALRRAARERERQRELEGEDNWLASLARIVNDSPTERRNRRREREARERDGRAGSGTAEDERDTGRERTRPVPFGRRDPRD